MSHWHIPKGQPHNKQKPKKIKNPSQIKHSENNMSAESLNLTAIVEEYKKISTIYLAKYEEIKDAYDKNSDSFSELGILLSREAIKARAGFVEDFSNALNKLFTTSSNDEGIEFIVSQTAAVCAAAIAAWVKQDPEKQDLDLFGRKYYGVTSLFDRQVFKGYHKLTETEE